MLGNGPLCLAARNALEAIPSEQAAKALRDSLPSLHGPAKAGVINSLGARREHKSVRVLARLLKDTDSSVAGAAAAALGNIGSTKAGATLRAFQPRAPEAIGQQVADAVLTCAERLRAGGARSAARCPLRPARGSVPAGPYPGGRQPRSASVPRQGLISAEGQGPPHVPLLDFHCRYSVAATALSITTSALTTPSPRPTLGARGQNTQRKDEN